MRRIQQEQPALIERVRADVARPHARSIRSRSGTGAGRCLGENFAARVDLKADRAAGTLRVVSAWLEPGWDPTYVAAELSEELTVLAGWLGLTGLEVELGGDLAGPLAARL